MRFVLDILYALALTVSSPVWLYRMIRHGRYLRDNSQRLCGAVPIRYGLQPIIWVHAVSLGEVNAARTLVDELHSQLPDFQVVVSATTETGMSAAERLFAPGHWVFRWPMDFSFAVSRALDRIRPDLVVLMEGEVWPNFLAACERRAIPVVIVNGRLGADKGYPRYRRLGPMARRLFGRLTAVGAQTAEYAEMFGLLGVCSDRLHVTGMMKFDAAVTTDHIAGQDELAAAFEIGASDKLVVAGGTGPGEEEMVLSQWPRLKRACRSVRLAIVPRKPERFEEVARLIAQKGFGVIRRSERPDGCEEPVDRDAIILGDTMGELRKFYSLAHCVFVGRSLVPMGGSDMIESAALGKATAFGPHTFNFPQAEDLAAHGCVRVQDSGELAEKLEEWLTDPSGAEAAGQAARRYVISQQGAARRNVEMICRALHRVPAAVPGDIATDEIDEA